MESLSRDKVLRWVRGQQSQGGSGGDGVSIDLAGYATQIWTEQNYVGKEFFSSLFKAYDANGNEVLPNDTETTIDNIKAMFGFWTDFYISALGNGGQQSVDLRLAQLADVNVAGVTNGQVLTYDTTTGKWIASTPQSGTDMATVWSNLAANGNQQIDASHLSTALTGYATQTWVTGKGYITSSGNITGNAGTATKLQTARTIWGQSFDGTANVDGSLHIHANGDNWNEGIRMHIASNGWCGIVMCGSDNTGTSGTSAKTWSIHNNDGGFYIAQNGSSSFTNGISCVNGSWAILSSGNVGIGTGSPSHKLHVNGGIYSTSYVTALSDAKHKDIIGDTGLKVEQIAGAPAIRFQWKDRDDQSIFAGSIAQYWQKILPEVVQSQADDTLSLDYQVAALISSITVARRVVNHESRLRRLEKMLTLNENDIEE